MKHRQQTTVIVDLQFGSTGKGLIAGYLAKNNRPDTVVSAFGPNAGHTFIDEHGTKFMHTMIPIGATYEGVERIMIGPGSVIDEDAMVKELESLHRNGLYVWDKVFIHQNAAIVGSIHRAAEKQFSKIGSTMKGTAEAVIHKMRRQPQDQITARFLPEDSRLLEKVVDADTYDNEMDKGEVIQVEGAQGFSLGLNQRFYPYVTSRECTAWQVLSDCSIRRAFNEITVVGTCRTFPIRVANRTDGTSGGCYPDQEETTFKAIGAPQEFTTVTKLPRRVFSFSFAQYGAALRANGVDTVFLNFVNYLRDPNQKAAFLDEFWRTTSKYGARVAWYGHGPSIKDIQIRWNQ